MVNAIAKNKGEEGCLAILGKLKKRQHLSKNQKQKEDEPLMTEEMCLDIGKEQVQKPELGAYLVC